MLSMQNRIPELVCPDIFAGKRVLVIGLGETGLSCVRFLYERGVELAITDSRAEPPGLQAVRDAYPDVAVFINGIDAQAVARADVLLVSPGVPILTPVIKAAIESGKEVIGDIEVFARCVDTPVVAITGSNGKSTVTSLVGEMARLAQRRVYVGGNIGTPALQLVEHNPEAELYVLELSSFQLETTHSLNAAASVILNLSEDHMDRYATLAEYGAAKAVIYRGKGAVVINADDTYVAAQANNIDPQRALYSFTLDAPHNNNTFGIRDKNGRAWLARGNQLLLAADEVRIKGRHNLANALAALALGTAVNLPMPAMLQALREFAGLPHRTQWVAEKNGVQWFNDSKATNVGAALAAIEGLAAQRLFVILGGQGKGQDFAPLREALLTRNSCVILLGEDAARIASALGDNILQQQVGSLQEAVAFAAQQATPGDVVLLSPACASFDMFRNYMHRGEVFMQLVKETLQ